MSGCFPGHQLTSTCRRQSFADFLKGTEFLKEISTLRDEVRIRGDPEKALGDGSLDEMVGNLGTVCHCPFLMENPAWLMSRGGPL